MKKQFSIFILTGLLFLFLRLTSLDGRITDMINVNNLSGVMDIRMAPEKVENGGEIEGNSSETKALFKCWTEQW